MTAIITLAVIAFFSLLAVRVATIALTMTGLSYDTAIFQSYSAFFGVGFTTREAELVVNHPVRRRIIRDLILAGNVGLTSALATTVASLLHNSHVLHPIVLLASVMLLIYLITYVGRIQWVRRFLDYWIKASLMRSGLVRAMDYELMLRVDHGYVILEYLLEDRNPLIGRTLRESRPWDSGMVVLAIRRNNAMLPGIPGPDALPLNLDVLVIYGHEHDLKKVMTPLS